MSKTVGGIIFYFCLLFFIAFIIPTGSTNEQIHPEQQDLNSTGVEHELKYATWDIGGSLKHFASFFSFGIINTLGMPPVLIFLFSMFNTYMAMMLAYMIMVLIRGGGGQP